MPLTLICANPYNPFEGQKGECPQGISVLEWLNSRAAGGKWDGFERPSYIILNGKQVLQKDYATTFLNQEKDILCLVTLAGYEAVYFFAILLIVSVAASFAFAPQPPALANSDTKEADSVYSLSGRNNANKLGQAVPCAYGEVRNWLDLAAEPYNIYQDNNQYLFIILTGGHGLSEFDQIRIGNTPIESYSDIEYEIVLPYGYVSLFRDAVIRLDEASGQEIFAPNEDDYDGPVGPFIINEFDEPIDRLEVDWSLPRGLYFQAENGALSARTVEAYFEYREIDENGDPVYVSGDNRYRIVVTQKNIFGVWKTQSKEYIYETHAYDDGHKTTRNYTVGKNIFREVTYYVHTDSNWKQLAFFKALKTIDPQRFTVGVDVPLGRYEIQFDRINNKDLSFKAGNDLFLDAVRGFMPNTTVYGDQTLIAIKALATSNLNNNSAQSFNVRQRRMLEIWDGEEWSERTLTRNPIWALCDACKAKYGGKLLDRHLDLPVLLSMASVFDTLGIHFDYIFSTKSNLWDILKTILAVGKAIPSLNGSKITVIRDYLINIPECMFTLDNMLENSFQWGMSLKKATDYDSIEVEYTNSESWKQETLLCLLDEDEGVNPEKVKLIGVTDRDKAYQLGLYYRATKKFRRETVSFKTNIQGHIPSLNALVAIVHDLPKWGSSGLLVSQVGDVLTLERPFRFILEPATSYVMLLKQRSGYASQPFIVTPIYTEGGEYVDSDKVTIEGLDIDLTRANTEEPVIYMIGLEDSITKYMRIKSIKPSGLDVVTIECVTNDNRIYDYDNEIAPDQDEASSIGQEDLPEIDLLEVETLADDYTKIRIIWSFVPDAVAYILQYSYDEESWTQEIITTGHSHVMSVLPDHLYLRVATLTSGAGPWKTWDGDVGIATNPPFDVTGLELQSDFTGLACYVQWQAAAGASQYVVEIYREPSAVLLRSTSVSGLSYAYSTDQALPDFAGTPQRALRFKVVAQNAAGDSETPAELAVSNPLPPAMTGIVDSITQNTVDIWELRIDWDLLEGESDLKAYQVFASPTNGFTPGPSNMVFNSISNFCLFTIPKSGGWSNYYYSICAIDYWGNELTNISAQATIALPP